MKPNLEQPVYKISVVKLIFTEIAFHFCFFFVYLNKIFVEVFMAKKQIEFYVCKHCGTLVGAIERKVVPVCCGETMTKLEANTMDASQEKHVPVATVKGNTVHVAVGSVAHPMESDHYIPWIYLETEHGGQRKVLNPGDAPAADFALTADDKALAVYAYCNKHGLWKALIK